MRGLHGFGNYFAVCVSRVRDMVARCGQGVSF